MDKIIRHGLQIAAGLDENSKKQMRAAIRDIFTDEAHIDFNNPENIKGLREFAEIFRKIFLQAGNTKFDFSKIIELPGPEIFSALKEAASEFEHVWFSIIEKIGSHNLADVFMQDLSALDYALNRLKKNSGQIKYIKKAFEDVHVKDPEKILERLHNAQEHYVAEDNINWETQYADLLKFINLYEKYVTNPEADFSEDIMDKISKIGPYTYEQLKKIEPQIRASLQNIFNLANNKPLLGLTEGGRIDFEAVPTVVNKLDVGDILGGNQDKIEVPVEFKIKMDKYREAYRLDANSEETQQLEEEISNMFPEDIRGDVIARLFDFGSLDKVGDRNYKALYKDFVKYGMPVGGSGFGIGDVGDTAENADDYTEKLTREAYQKAEKLFDDLDNLYDEIYKTENPDDVDALLEKRKKLLSEFPDLVRDSYDEAIAAAERENALIEQRVKLLREVRTGKISVDDIDNIMAETGDLDSKLERLQDISGDWGLNIKNDDADEDEDAIAALQEFEETYDRIILKLANGRKIEILPNAKGLRALYKYSDGLDPDVYGETEIEDVEFVRRVADDIQTLANEIGVKIPESTERATQAVGELNNELDIAGSKVETDVSSEASTNDAGSSIDIEALKGVLSAITYNVRVVQDEDNSTEDAKVNIDAEALKGVLNSITYNVKVIQDGESAETKISIDETSLENVLKRVFVNIINPQTQQNDSELQSQPWALESTLQAVKGVLDQIQTNTTRIKTTATAPVNTGSKNALATEKTLAAIKKAVEAINTKVVKGTKSGTSNRRQSSGSNENGVNSESFSDSRYFPEKLKTQALYLAKFKATLMATGKLTDEVDKQIYELLDKLALVKNGPDFSEWNQKFLQLKTSVGITDIFDGAEDERVSALYKEIIRLQELRNKLEIQYLKAKDGSNLKQFYADQIKLIDGVIARQEDMIRSEEYEVKLSKLRADQERRRGEANAKLDDKDIKRMAAEARREAMLGRTSGAITKGENAWMNANAVDFDGDISFLKSYYDKLDALRKKYQELKNSDFISEEQKKDIINQTIEFNKLTAEIEEFIRLSGSNTQVMGVNTLGANAGLSDYEAELKRAVHTFTNGKAQIKGFNAETKTLTYVVKTGKNEFTEYTAAVRHADGQLVTLQGTTKRTETFLEATKRKMKEISSYMSGMALFSRLWQELRRGVQYVREIDLALTELRKVTDETEETYDEFLKTAAKTGAKLGATISAVTEATATFAKLGYTIEQASKMAEAAIVYKNVGDGIESTEDAANSIISTLKGFGMEASESMEIIDRFNEVGNKFAITSKGIGEALRLSASALNEGGNSLDESIGLITAANEVVNDPNAVGTALKTLTLRLRGSKTELEEMGEDVTDMATTTSQLQAKLLALTGGQVDIMLDENTFKNSTQILREMADAWEDMNDIQRASALELMGGKRQANILSAIIQNFNTVESVIEASANSAGSALQENEKYLDSIQGKIDQFSNAMQSMWSNTLDSDMVKGMVAFGTEIIKVIDKIGLLNSLFIALATYSMIKNKMGPIGFLSSISDMIRDVSKKAVDFIGRITGMATATSAYTAETLSASVANGTLSASEAANIATKNGLTMATTKLNAVEAVELLTKSGIAKADALAIVSKLGLSNATKKLTVDTLTSKMAAAGYTKEQIAAATAALFGAGANKTLAASFGALWTAMWPILAVMAAVGVIYGIVKAFDAAAVTTEELSEELSNLNSELSDIESKIDSLNSELKTTKERMAELIALPSLSFVEQEELKNLQLQNAELERQLKLQEMLAESKKAEKVKTSEKFIESAWNDQGDWYIDDYGVVREDSGLEGFFLGDSKETKVILDEAIQEYTNKTAKRDKITDILDSHDSFSKDDFSEDELTRVYEFLTGFKPSQNKQAYENFKNSDLKKILLDSKNELDENILNMATGINQVFAQEEFDGLEYGMSDEIDAFLDELYAYQLKWQEAQGAYIKSEAISSMFDATSTKEMQTLGRSLQEIADSDISDEQKTQKILDEVDAIDKTSDAYNRLEIAMNTVGVTAQDIADYFVLDTGAFNSNTVEGITNQYKAAKTVLENLKSGAINLDDLVKYDNESGEATGRVDVIAEQLKGVDTNVREQFTAIVESIKEGAYDTEEGLTNWDAAIRKMELQGMQAVIENVKAELEVANKLAFPDLEISGWIDSVDELKGAFEGLASAMDLIVTAQKQMDSSGRISLKTALDLMSATDDWSQILEVNNGVITMNANAEQILIQSKLDLIKANIEMALQQVETDIATMEGAINSAEAGNVLVKGLGGAIKHVQSGLVGLKAGWEALWSGEDVFEAIKGGYQQTIDNLTPDETSLGELYQQKAELEKKLNMIGGVDTTQEFKDNYDFDKTPGDKYDDEAEKIEDGWDKLNAKYENKLALIMNERDLIQAEIDRMEAQGGKASAQYYEDLIRSSEEEKALLAEKLAAQQAYLDANKANMDQDTWTEYNNEINETAVAIKECEVNTLEWVEALREIDTHYFEQITDEVSRLGEELEFVNGLLEDEEVADENGNWSSTALTRIGLYTQQMEKAAAEAKLYQDEIDKVNEQYKNGELSKEQYQERLADLVSGQQDAIMSYEDAKNSIVEMNEARVDAIKEGIEKEIEAYEDLIEAKKEELDAERD